MWVYCIYDLFLFIVAWFVVEHSLIMPIMCQNVIMGIHGNYWNSPHHWLWTIIDLDEGFFGVESVWRTQGALIPHSLFSWMSGPFTVQAEVGGWWLSPMALVSLCAAWEGGWLSDVNHPFTDLFYICPIGIRRIQPELFFHGELNSISEQKPSNMYLYFK